MVNADHIAVLLEEHARVEDGRLANIPYLAVKIAEALEADAGRAAPVPRQCPASFHEFSGEGINGDAICVFCGALEQGS